MKRRKLIEFMFDGRKSSSDFFSIINFNLSYLEECRSGGGVDRDRKDYDDMTKNAIKSLSAVKLCCEFMNDTSSQTPQIYEL